MRGTIGRRVPYGSFSFTSNASARQTLIPFSTSSSGGGGRGRGRGGATRFDFCVPAPGEPLPDEDPSPPGLGHGRGRPMPSSPILPSFSSFVAAVGRGRGRGPPSPPESDSKKPIFFKREDGPPQSVTGPPDARISELPPEADAKAEGRNREIPADIFSALSGAGRGKPFQRAGPEAPVEENRHLRARPLGPHPEAIRRDAVRRTVGILSGDGPEGSTIGGRGGGRGRGRGFQGRGRGRGAFGRGGRGGAFRERSERDAVDKDSTEQDDDEDGLYLGDNADGEKFADRMGAEKMSMLAEAFEEMGNQVLPSPAVDHHLDAFHTNCLVHCFPFCFQFLNLPQDEFVVQDMQ